MKLFALATLALAANYVSAYCPNLCSGHGTCGSGDVCTCYEYVGTARGDYTNEGSAYATGLRQAWTGADCSLRTCPLAYSWSGATPNGLSVSKTINTQTANSILINEDLTMSAGADVSLSAGSQIRTAEDGLLTVTGVTYVALTSTTITYRETSGTSATTVYLAAGETDTTTDSKDVNGAHGMLECAGQGICDRSTGNCECFPGYEGEACTRSVCPNDCSGNGICLSAERLAADASHTYTMAWDSDKHFGCKCDAGFRGPDCSLQECPSDYDPLFGCGGGQCNNGGTDDSGAACPNQYDSDCTNDEQRDCSGRGICDYESGVCKCFSGFFGEACEKQTILI
jgi:hypothetical protein